MKNFAPLGINDYLKILWKRRWYVIMSTLVVTTVVTYIAWRLPSVYKSETTIVIDPQTVSDAYVKPTATGKPEDSINLITRFFKSRNLLERLIVEYKLESYERPRRFLMDDAVEDMRRDIEVTRRSSNSFTLTYFSHSPQLAHDITKRLADEVIQSLALFREDQAVGTDQFIDEQLRNCQRDLSAQEEKLKAFKLRHLGALPEQNSGNMSALNGLHNQLIANESALQRGQDQRMILEQRLEDQRRLDQLALEMAAKSGGKEGSSAVVRTSPRASLRAQLDVKRSQLVDLTLKYTDKFPDVIRLKREVEDLERQLGPDLLKEGWDFASAKDPTRATPILAGVESDISAIKTQLTQVQREFSNREKERADIQEQIGVYQARLNLSPRVEQELFSLTRDVEALRTNYRALQDKKFNSQVAANLEKSTKSATFKNVRVIDEAYLPQVPVKPNRRLIALMGLMAGFSLGLGMGIAVEYFDSTLGDEDAVASEVNLPVLVSIPEIPKNRKTLSISSGSSQRLLKQA